MKFLIVNKFRKMLLCLLVLAIPAQGYAAATMRFCSPAIPTVQLQEIGSQSHHAQPNAVIEKIQSGGSSAVDHSQMNHHGSNVKDDSQKSAESKCSVCAACCHAIAIITTVPSAVHILQLATSVAQPRLEAIIFLTGGLERPPRTLFA